MQGEFSFIDGIRKRSKSGSPGLKLGIGDDTAIFEENPGRERLITTDLLVEGVHFKTEYSPFKLLGHKALAVSLSDIAAMGGRPDYALLSLGIPGRLREGRNWEEFFDGYFGLAGRHNVDLIGGDTSGSQGSLIIDSIVLGSCPSGRAIRRSGAKAGDGVFVTGRLGGSAAGLELLSRGRTGKDAGADEAAAIEAHLEPEPRVDFGLRIGGAGLASAMLDVSDGLAGDLLHICEESQVSAAIELSRIPVPGYVERLFADPAIRLTMALSGGEDYELLFTAAEKNENGVLRIGAEIGLEVSRIGTIIPISATGGTPGVCERTGSGFDLIEFKGYDHFLP